MTAEDVTPDYTLLASHELLGVLQDDAMKWAISFNQHAVKLGYSAMDVGWLVGWFANAIEHSGDVRHWRAQPASKPVVENFPE